LPGELEGPIRAFVEYYSYQRYHERLGDVTPYDVYTGRHLEIIIQRRKQRSEIAKARRDCTKTARKLGEAFKCLDFRRPDLSLFR
jgi:hypothetical protein